MLKSTIYHSLAKTLPSDTPKTPLKSATALKNERYNFLLYVECDHNEKCTISVSGQAPYLVRKLDVVDVKLPVFEQKDDYVLSDQPGKFYDILREINTNEVTLSAEENNVFFISLLGDKEPLVSGNSEITVTVSANEEKATASFCLSVVDCDMEKSDIFVTHWMHYDCIAETYGVEPFTEEFYKYFQAYLENFVEHGNNMILTPLFTPPLDTKPGSERLTAQLVDVTKENETYVFDFKKLDYFLDFVFARGIKYVEFSHLFTQWGAEFCPKVVVKENGVLVKKFGWNVSSLSEEYLGFLAQFLPALVDFITRKGVKEKCFYHLSDEPSEEYLDRYKTLSDFVKSHVAGGKIMDAVSSYEFYLRKLTDVAVVGVDHAKTFMKHGVEHAVYNCCFPADGYYTNRFIAFPAERMRVLGAMMYYNNAKGYLHWGYNFYNARLSEGRLNPYESPDALGKFPAGDPFIVYPTENGCIDSIRNETFLESMQDFRALKTLERLAGREVALSVFANDTIGGYNEYPHSAEWLLELRNRVNAEIKARIV